VNTSRTIRTIPGATRSALLGGLLSGLVGALLFATAHAVLIAPIWTRMWSGFPWGALAGVSAGWMMIEVFPTVVTTTPAKAAALGVLLGASLWFLVAPVSVVFAILRAAGTARHELAEVFFAVALAISTGAAFGWYRTRRWRATIAGGLASLMLMLGMAGPVPIERSQRAVHIFLAVLPAAALAGSVLGLVVRWLELRRIPRTDDG
jgi:hypothetical protein